MGKGPPEPQPPNPQPNHVKRIVLIALVAVLGTAFVPSPSGRAGSTFTFHGSGFGHGLGMSQWGAYGLAKQGWGHARILTHFYEHTRVRRDLPLPSKVRVGITWDRRTVHLTARGGPVALWLGATGSGTPIGQIPKGQTFAVSASRDAYAIRDASGALVGGKKWGAPGVKLIASYVGPTVRVFVAEAEPSSGREYGRGDLEFNLYGCDGTRCLERVIVRVKLQHYLYGLGEVPSSWPAQALRAQATAARSYAVYGMRRYGLRGYCHCDLTDGSSDQVYVGYSKESGTDGDRWVAAVDATKDEVVAYQGKVIQAFYAASDGGHSENVEDVWHGGNPDAAIPWLTGVCDPGESVPANPWTDWSRSFGASELTTRLRPYTGDIGVVTGFGAANRGVSGRIITIVVQGATGQRSIGGGSLRSALGLWDDRVWVNSDRNIVGMIREKYDGLMCRPGLPSSSTTYVDHGSGQRFQKGGIYRNDAMAKTVWLRGAYFDEYRGVGEVAGSLGLPTSGVVVLSARSLSCTACGRVTFERGRIYWRSDLGAHALWGRVLTTYLDNGGAAGSLGFPTTRVQGDGAGGAIASFEGGSIWCPKGADCVVS